MSNITIQFNTDNQAFEEYAEDEVTRILKDVARRFEDGTAYDGMPIRDINGNKIGEVLDERQRA